MNLLLIEPYYTGSHRSWAEELKKYSSHNIELLTMPGYFWKWRIHGGTVTLSRQYLARKDSPDAILATDMLNLNGFISLIRKKSPNIPCALYFHENQLNYPWSPIDRDVKKKRDQHYCFINYLSAYTADRVFFNSAYHKNSFLLELEKFLKTFPDNNEISTVKKIKEKSEVLHIGMDLKKTSFNKKLKKNTPPLILWNHRWEHDKNPEKFINTLISLKEEKIGFNVVFLGEKFNKTPEIFLKAKKMLGDRILHFGYIPDRNKYVNWVKKSDILPVTSSHDFFGKSVVEAVHYGCIPLLPKKLSYPEIIPISKYPQFFYSPKETFKQKLRNMILNQEQFDAPVEAVERFNWKNIIGKYDKALGELALPRR